MSEPFPDCLLSCDKDKVPCPCRLHSSYCLRSASTPKNPKRRTKIPPGPTWNFLKILKTLICVCVCMLMYVHIPTEARRGHPDPLELQIQVFVSS